MTISGVNKASGQKEPPQNVGVEKHQLEGRRGLPDVPDHLELEPLKDQALLSGVFSLISDSMIAFYEYVISLTQIPLNWLFGGAEKPEDVPDPGPRPRSNTDADLKEDPKWNKAMLLLAMETPNLPSRLKTLLEVAEKGEDKELKVKKSEAFEIIQKFQEYEADTFATIMERCGGVDNWKDSFKYSTFYTAVLREMLSEPLGQIAHIIENERDKSRQLHIVYSYIPPGVERNPIQRERRQVLETARILVSALYSEIKNGIRQNMCFIDEAQNGALGFRKLYFQELNEEELFIDTYLKKDDANLALLREAISILSFKRMMDYIELAEWPASDWPIEEKWDTLLRAITTLEDEDQKTKILAAFERTYPDAYAILEEKCEDLRDKDRLRDAIQPTKLEIQERVREAEERAAREAEEREAERLKALEAEQAAKAAAAERAAAARKTLLDQLADGNRDLREQLGILMPLIEGEDRQALQSFTSVPAQLESLAEAISLKCTDEERAELSQLAAQCVEEHPDNDSVGGKAKMLAGAMLTRVVNTAFDADLESDRTQRDRAAIKAYLMLDGKIATATKETLLIAFREE